MSRVLFSSVGSPSIGVIVPLWMGKMLPMAQKGWGWSLGLSCSLDASHRYVDGRVIVIEVLPGSQAEVDEVVLAGDVLDEINGCSLRNAYSGQVGGMTSPSPRSSLRASPCILLPSSSPGRGDAAKAEGTTTEPPCAAVAGA